jgi:hypothetical protein
MCIRRARLRLEQSEGRSSFLKKRSKRLLRFQGFVPQERSATASDKVFWFFSSEKNALLSATPFATAKG